MSKNQIGHIELDGQKFFRKRVLRALLKGPNGNYL